MKPLHVPGAYAIIFRRYIRCANSEVHVNTFNKAVLCRRLPGMNAEKTWRNQKLWTH